MRRKSDREGPGKSVFEIFGSPAEVVLRPHVDQSDLAVAVVVALQYAVASRRAADGADIGDVGIFGMHHDVAALAGPHRIAMAPGDGAVLGGAGYGDAGIVLLGGVDLVGKAAVGRYAIELGGHLVVDGRPGRTAVKGDAGAAVVALDHALRVARVDPQVVVVAVGRGYLRKGAPTVGRFPHLEIGNVHGFGIAGVGEDVAVIKGTLVEFAVVAHQLPGIAAVVGAEQAAFLGFDNGPDPATAGRGGGNADFAFEACGQAGSIAEFFPGVAAVSGAKDAAAGAAAGQGPEIAVGLPDRGVEDARVSGVHGQVHGAGFFAAVEHFVPGVAAVSGAEDAALGVGSEDVAQGCHVDQIGVLRVDADFADVAGFFEADVAPARTAVGRFVDAVAIGDIEADIGLAGAGVKNVGVGLGQSQSTDGGGGEVAVRDILPVGAAVVRFPHAAAAGAEVEDHVFSGMSGYGGGPAAARGTDAAPLQGL